MSMFFVLFFTLYAALNAYVFIRTWNDFRFSLVTGGIVAIAFLLCVFLPLFTRSFEHGVH